MNTTRVALTIDDGEIQRLFEHAFDSGWTDGLPTVPCTEEAVQRFLQHTDRDPDEVMLEMTHLNRSCTVRSAAITAVMAGCKPEYFPVVLAAWDAVREDSYAAVGMWQSTTGIATMLVVNGPVRHRIGMNSGSNIFASGFRANATIGRALRLAAINVFGLAPGVMDQSTQATPAKYSMCLAENEENSPWPSFATELGHPEGASTVGAIHMRSVAHIEARCATTAEQLLHDIAGTLTRTGGLLQPTNCSCLVLSPEHAHFLADRGWDKPRVREFLFENAVVPVDVLARVGKDGLSRRQSLRLPSAHADAVADDHAEGGRLRVLATPDRVNIVVAGAPNSGISAVVEGHGAGVYPPATAVVEERSGASA